MRMRWPLFFAAVGILLLSGGLIVSSKLSKRGIDHLKEQEGFSARIYQDEAGNWTIGYGHKLTPEDNYTIATNMTPEDAEALLIQDVAKAEAAIKRYVTVPLSSGQYDALVSFIFNVGVSAFADSTLLRKLNIGDYAGAANELARWNKITVNGQKVVSAILVNRRDSEQELFYA